MKITVTSDDGAIFTLDVSDDLEVENFRALLEYESGVPSDQISLFHDGVPMNDLKKSLSAYSIKDGDVVLMMRRQAARPAVATNPGPVPMSIDWGQIQLPGQNQPPRNSQQQPAAAAATPAPVNQESPEYIRDMFLNDPHQMSLLKERNPELAEALLSGDLPKFTTILNKQRQERMDREMRRIRTMNADIFDAEAQREIAEEIRMANINQNMETAMEHTPESFAKVIMLYINIKLNGHPVKAFVDSGAQMTFMSSSCAARIHIERLIDHRWSGIAQGVGQQKIVGRVHMAQIQIENDFLPLSFSVLQDQSMDLIVGLDMLKRHQCCIDLKDNILRIGSTGTETPFLSEADLPDFARPSYEPGEQSGSMQETEDRNLAEALTRSAQDTSTSTSTPASSVPASGTATSTGGAGAHDFPEQNIKQLVDMGFPREKAIQALRQANGDVNLAAATLLAQSIQVPKSS